MSKISSVNIKRVRIFLSGWVILCLLLMGRLWYLQIFCHEQLSALAASQYQVEVEGLDVRGAILDRNLEPLTGSTAQYYFFLRSDRETEESAELLSAVSARKISAAAGSSGQKYAVYRTELYDEIAGKRLQEEYGAYVLQCTSRYSDEQIACHLIGYLNESEKKGVSGLEKACEAKLQAGSGSLYLWADGSGNLLLNMPPVMEGGETFPSEGLITTIDSSLQRISEDALASSDSRGAVLVSDASTGQILAWVSAPWFNPNTVSAYLQQESSSSGSLGDSNLVNKVIQGTYAPGSVFKTVVAAAALESGIRNAEDVYVCTGTTEVGGVTLGCRSGPAGGHGEVNLYRAMAVSCNCYFAELGEELGTERILETAQKLGLGKQVFAMFTEEAEGYVPQILEVGEWDISNLSIGQGDLRVTPVQVHRMMSVAACGGMEIPLTVVKDGSSTEPCRILSEETAAALSDMLSLVMTEGTGSSGMGREWLYPAYGKTGTAEAVLNGQAVNHCWFSGYTDVGGRRYVITVLIEDGQSGSASALPLFHEIAEYLQVRTIDFS